MKLTIQERQIRLKNNESAQKVHFFLHFLLDTAAFWQHVIVILHRQMKNGAYYRMLNN